MLKWVVESVKNPRVYFPQESTIHLNLRVVVFFNELIQNIFRHGVVKVGKRLCIRDRRKGPTIWWV